MIVFLNTMSLVTILNIGLISIYNSLNALSQAVHIFVYGHTQDSEVIELYTVAKEMKEIKKLTNKLYQNIL